MAIETDRQIRQIEETQAALRHTIDEAKALAERAQELLQKQKKGIDQQR
jgi:hypothetical protein